MSLNLVQQSTANYERTARRNKVIETGDSPTKVRKEGVEERNFETGG